MASVLSRLASLFPSYRRTYTPAVATPEERAARIISATKAGIEQTTRRPRPSSEEKVPTNYHGGSAGSVWFLPYADSTTGDTPEIRAAMRLMRRDGYVKAAWEPQILTVAGEDWQVQPSEAGNPESEEQAAATKTMIEEYLEGGIVSIVRAICAPFGSEGHSLAEPVWHPGRRGKLEKHVVCTKFSAKDTDPVCGDVRLGGDGFNNVKWVQARRAAGQTTFPIDQFVFSRYLSVFDEPLGEAAFRPAYGKYWMRDTVSKLRIIHHEKRMAGMLMGTYENDDDKPALEDALRRAKTSTWVAVPAGVKLEAIGLSTASEPDYRSFDEGLRDEIVIAIAFATLQVLTSAGPELRGDSSVQKAMSDLGPWLLMRLVTDAVNRQFIPKFIDFNYPYPAGGSYPKLTFGAASNAELLELLSVVEGAQRVGFKGKRALSKKHYATALSLQLADPNDPEDALEPTDPAADPMAAMGSMGGGFPPDPGMSDPAMLEPTDPGAGGVGVQPFAEQVHVFGWTDWKRSGERMVSASGKRSLTLESFQRLSTRARKPRPAAGARPRASAPAPVRAPTPPSAPAPASPPAPPSPPEPAPQPTQPGRGGAGRAAVKAGLAAARAAGKGAARAAGGGVWAGAKAAQGVAYVQDKLGAALERVPVLESVFGVGSGMRKAAQRQMRQARNTALLAVTGQRGTAAKRAATGLASYLDIKFPENQKRFGTTRAIVIEGLILGLKAAAGAVATGGAIALTGVAAPSVGALATGGAALTGLAAAAYASKSVIRSVLNPFVRGLVEYGFRYGKGGRGLSKESRVLQDKMKRTRARQNAGKSTRARDMTAAPGATTREAREVMNRTGGKEFYPGPGKASRRTVYADLPVIDPMDLVTSLRQQLEEASGAPVDLTDVQLADLLVELLEYADDVAADRGDATAETFAEEAAGVGLEWDCFGWQAARTRSGSVKAVGTAQQQGQVLYGARARAALARNSGAGERQRTARTVTYDTTDADGTAVRRRADNVSPARARAMAVASQLAALEPGGDRPTEVKVRKQRARAIATEAQKLGAVAQKAAGGDEAARTEVTAKGTAAVRAAATELVKLGPVPAAEQPKIRAAWTAAARDLPRGERRQISTLLDSTLGQLGRDTEAVAGGALKLAQWIGTLARPVAALAVRALGRFAKGLARLGLAGAKAVGRGALNVAGSVASAAWPKLKLFARWAGAVVGGAALMAAPVIAFKVGLIPFVAAAALAPVAVGATVALTRRFARANDAGAGFEAPLVRFAENEFVPAGPDGARAMQLLDRARADGAEVFAKASESAVRRLLASGDPLNAPVLFDDAELGDIAQALGRCVATADLMGRARIRRRAELAEKEASAFAEGKPGADYSTSYSDPFHDFADVPVVEPLSALEYFRRLVPTLGGSPTRYGPKLDRHAFTLAVASDQTVLEKVKAAILKQLQTGQGATPSVDQVLDDAGVSVSNPQYADMVVRTNVLDAYNQGAQDEIAEPDMQERFPAWEYLGVLDDRTGDDHRPRIGKYFPASVPFAEVRGTRVWNCRCSFAPVSKHLMNGIRVEGSW